MGRNRDHTDIPNTCPFIDNVIRFIDSIDFDDDMSDEAVSICKILEEIRTHNSDLRDFGNEQYNRAEELNDDCNSYKETINELEYEIIALKKELDEAEDRYQKLEEYS